MEEGLRKIIKELYFRKIILFGDFKLTSGLTSPYYIDLRSVYSYPDLFKEIIDYYIFKIDDFKDDVDVIAGIESGSIAIAAVLGYILDKPMIYIRKEPKKIGMMKLIEGVLNEGDKVVIVDDVATTGGSIARGVKAIREAGGYIDRAIIFIDRLQGARENLSRLGVKLYSILDIKDVLNILYRDGLISPDTRDKILNYIGGGDV
ncbi:orotate phosphoribosyltransferase [Candidatus Geothermarchaeota archaeon]|nr:MAG: orotate phosphoribosyltransferase [Candidatus Geothermarchaeota archaeon]HEW93809.1 orotate phosphoribosyltransferase [Thermoprotei archaeon]